MRYEVRSTLQNGNLRQFAQLYMSGNNRLAGLMNGKVHLTGVGTNPKSLSGTGNLVISPAALYELPVMAQIFNVLSFVPPDKTAFNRATFAFAIGGGQVIFERIDLIGDAITLVGNGTVNFDGAVRLGFASRMGRRTVPIPIVHEMLNATTKGWVGVDVRGTLRDPRPEVRTLDDALRRLLNVFDPRMPPRR
jgi:hypothetical protein